MSRGFKIAIGLFVALFILVVFPEILVLLVGWVRFIGNVGPKIEVNWSGVGMLVLILGLLAGVGHSFCSWLWRSSGHQERWKPDWTAAGISGIVLMFAAGMAFTGLAHQTGWLLFGPEPMMVNSGIGVPWRPWSPLKSIAAAQNDFRAHDRDVNHKRDYWRQDIAGLYALKTEETPIKLIELSLALADADAKTDLSEYMKKEWLPQAKMGYFYRALRFWDEKEPDPGRFAAAAYPTSLSAGMLMYIMADDGRIWMKPYTNTPPGIYPEDPRKDGWEPLRD